MVGKLIVSVIALAILLFGVSAASAVDWSAFTGGEEGAVSREIQDGSGILFVIGPVAILIGIGLLYGAWFVKDDEDEGDAIFVPDAGGSAEIEGLDAEEVRKREKRLRTARTQLEEASIDGKMALRDGWASDPTENQDLIELADQLIREQMDA